MEGGAGAERVVRGHLWRPMGSYGGRGKVLFFAPPPPPCLDFSLLLSICSLVSEDSARPSLREVPSSISSYDINPSFDLFPSLSGLSFVS